MARLQIEFHVPIFYPFIKFVKIFLERSCVCLKLKSYRVYTLWCHQQSLTVEVILSGKSLM